MTKPDLEHLTLADSPSPITGDLMPPIKRFLRVLRLRRQVVFCTLYVFGLAGAIYYILAPRLYQSSAAVLIVDQKQDQISTVGTQDTTGTIIATHRELVVSPVVIEKAIQQLEPQFRTDLYHRQPQEWVEAILEELTASITRKTNIISVSYRSRNPEAAAAVVRSVIQAYLAFVQEHHRGAAGEFEFLLKQRRDDVQQALTAKQAELQHLRQLAGHLAISPESQVVEPMIQRALRLNEALLQAQEKRLVLQATRESVEAALARGEDISQYLMGIESTLGRQMLLASMGMSPEELRVQMEQKNKLLASQQELASLSGLYGPNHPRMIELQKQVQSIQDYLQSYQLGSQQRMDEIGKALPDQALRKMLEQGVVQAEQVEAQLSQSYELARAEAAAQSGVLLQLRTLEREVLRMESELDTVIKSIGKIDRIQVPVKATVIREPLPGDVPVSPELRFVVFVCLAGGLFVGGVIVYVQDLLDDRFSSPEELAGQLGVAVLSVVRKLAPLEGDGWASLYTHSLPNSVEAEAFRTLRTSLSLGGDVCDRILVSSSEPGDGKTTISANLSVAFAQAGKKTLVIDADLRRPGFSTLVGLKGVPGVADILAADQPAETLAPTLIHSTEIDGLDVLPVGLRRPNPAELLSGSAFVELLAWADSAYDRVIIDCPPVLAVSDAQIVGQLVDGAVLVVRPEKNHRRSVIRAVESFQSAGCRVLGVVVNGVSTEDGGYGYGYDYQYGYGHEEEHHESAAEEHQPSFEVTEYRLTTNPSVRSTTVPIRAADQKSVESIRPRRAA